MDKIGPYKVMGGGVCVRGGGGWFLWGNSWRKGHFVRYAFFTIKNARLLN